MIVRASAMSQFRLAATALTAALLVPVAGVGDASFDQTVTASGSLA